MLRKHPSLILALAAGIAGCPADEQKKTDETAATGETKEAVTPADPKPGNAPIELPPGDGPVAKVNDAEIPRDVFNREFTQTIERYQRARHEVKPALYERLKDNIVRRLVDAEIISQQAKKMGVQISNEERESKWAEHKKRYGSEDAFKAFLERAGTSEEDVRRQFDSNLVREKVFAKVSETVEVKPEEVKDFYDKNQSRYDEPEQVRASHILIRLPPGASPEVKAEKKKRAEEVAKKAKKGDFAALAKEYGEDPTKDRGGDLGFFTTGRMVKAFEEAVWKMKPGQVSGVVETQFGFHVIKKTEHKKARKKPFAEVKEQIERSLEARKRNTAIREALQKWKDESKIEIFVKGDEAIINAGRSTPDAKTPMIQLQPGDKPFLKKDLQIKKLPKPVTSDHPAH
jgi:peptidyl-prolyl cis-trans isomerase C